MRRSLTLSLIVSVAVCLGLFIGCDSSPSSVQDFDIQPDVQVSPLSVTFVDGQVPPPTVTVEYQGIDSHPEASASGALQVEKVEESGSPEQGSQIWRLTYGEDLDQDQIVENLFVETTGNGNQIADTLSVQVNNPIAASESFESNFAGVADYEENDRSAQGGTSIQVDDSQASENSTGSHVLEVNGSPSGSFTLERRASLPDMDIFSFLVKPSPNTDFDLTVTLEEESGDSTRTEEVTVTVPSGDTWRKYSIAFGSLFQSFDPVAKRAGGTGPLTSATFSADSDVTYFVDQVGYGTSGRTLVEIQDFENTTLEYNFGGVELDTSSSVAVPSDGFISRDIDSPGDGGFGYNYDGLSMNATSSTVVSLWIGNVTKAFNLYVFLETPNGEGGFEYGNGIEVEIAGEAEWRRITVPVIDLGGDNADPAALNDPGLSNVGFEVRRPSSDDTSDPIDFLLDDVKLTTP